MIDKESSILMALALISNVNKPERKKNWRIALCCSGVPG